jgi:hypothetical protein
VLSAVAFQLVLKDLAFTTFGVLRTVQPLSDFPAYTCRKLEHPSLQACEDLWLDEHGRTLYLACSDPINRKYWQPTVNRRNFTGRKPGDHVTVLDIDREGSDGLFHVRTLATSGYVGAFGGKDKSLDLHGFDVEDVGDDTLRFWMVNHRPPVDVATGLLLDSEAVGMNSTVEVFELNRGGGTLKHVKTYADTKAIRTPNRVALTGEGGFVMTNDHKDKVGFGRQFEPVIGGGSLTHCGPSLCHQITPNNLIQPNGLTRGHDGLIYVPSSATGIISVFSFKPFSGAPGSSPSMATHVADIKVGMPMDNLSVDRNGDIWAASFPKVAAVLAGFDDPLNTPVPSAVYRIRKVVEEGKEGPEGAYVVEKMLEDRDAEKLPGTTTVIHDAETGRLFLGGTSFLQFSDSPFDSENALLITHTGVFSPFITICDKR